MKSTVLKMQLLRNTLALAVVFIGTGILYKIVYAIGKENSGVYLLLHAVCGIGLIVAYSFANKMPAEISISPRIILNFALGTGIGVLIFFIAQLSNWQDQNPFALIKFNHVLLNSALIALGISIYEECLFRYFLQKNLTQILGGQIGTLLQIVLFALGHFLNDNALLSSYNLELIALRATELLVFGALATTITKSRWGLTTAIGMHFATDCAIFYFFGCNFGDIPKIANYDLISGVLNTATTSGNLDVRFTGGLDMIVIAFILYFARRTTIRPG
jgi:membrane protease YdiL (CAAX protease family)